MHPSPADLASAAAASSRAQSDKTLCPKSAPPEAPEAPASAADGGAEDGALTLAGFDLAVRSGEAALEAPEAPASAAEGGAQDGALTLAGFDLARVLERGTQLLASGGQVTAGSLRGFAHHHEGDRVQGNYLTWRVFWSRARSCWRRVVRQRLTLWRELAHHCERT